MIRETRRTLPVLALELLDEVVGETVVAVLTQFEGTSTEIEDEDVMLAGDLLVKTAGNAAAVGSLMIRRTSRPTMVPASLVA